MNNIISKSTLHEDSLLAKGFLDAEAFQKGKVLLIDKPYQWTSFDVVRKVKGLTKTKKIGHAGTLDPLATGLLILCTGRKTKEIDQFQAQEKGYEGTLVIGKTTPSIDLETPIEKEYDISCINSEKIKATAQKFIGNINQIPPQHSAIKVKGERVYKKAREGKMVTLNPREITIDKFAITTIDLPEVGFEVICSKGTYIRSLVRDFGEALDSGAYLKQLRRTSTGAFKVEDALTLEELNALLNRNSL